MEEGQTVSHHVVFVLCRYTLEQANCSSLLGITSVQRSRGLSPSIHLSLSLALAFHRVRSLARDLVEAITRYTNKPINSGRQKVGTPDQGMFLYTYTNAPRRLCPLSGGAVLTNVLAIQGHQQGKNMVKKEDIEVGAIISFDPREVPEVNDIDTGTYQRA